MAMTEEINVLHYPAIRPENWLLLQRAAQRRSIRLVTWEPHLLTVEVSDDGVTICYDGVDASARVLLHRTVSPFRGIVLPALEYLIDGGTVVLNHPAAAYRTRDKLLTALTLQHVGIPIVPTLAVNDLDERAARRIGDVDVILKPAHGVRGEGIQVIRKGTSLNEPMPTRTSGAVLVGYYIQREHYLAQPLLHHGGHDIRAFVVGDQCIALMRRKAQEGEVRANLALGASAQKVRLPHPASATAEAAIRACCLDYGSVDLIEDGQGVIRVLEVDAWGGFAGITSVTGADVAGEILDYASHASKRGP
jgi:ribosomal protein S6--L-glutamate ligase